MPSKLAQCLFIIGNLVLISHCSPNDFTPLNNFQVILTAEDLKQANAEPTYFPGKFSVQFEDSTGQLHSDSFIKISRTDWSHPITAQQIYVFDELAESPVIYRDYHGDHYELYVTLDGHGQATLIRNPSNSRHPFRLVYFYVLLL